MNEYEMVVVAKSTTPQEEKNLIEEIQKLIKDVKGKVTEMSELGKKRLSFPIKKQSEGSYWLITFQLENTLPDTLNKKIKILGPLLRYMIVKKENRAESLVKGR